MTTCFNTVWKTEW